MLTSPLTLFRLSILDTVGHQDTLYGDQSEDSGSEVRFSVELTEISGLKSTYSIDIRRLKGPLRSYKYMYDTLRE